MRGTGTCGEILILVYTIVLATGCRSRRREYAASGDLRVYGR